MVVHRATGPYSGAAQGDMMEHMVGEMLMDDADASLLHRH